MPLSVPLRDYPLIFITDRHRSLDRGNLEVVHAALQGGCRWVMYREPDLDDATFYEECLKVKEMCDEVGAGLLVNDRLDIASLVRAEGVHLGKGDLPVRVVKEFMGEDFIVGYSAHSIQEAITTAWEGADYITFSPLFKLAHKETQQEPHGLKGANEVLTKVEVPVFFLGGIQLTDINDLRKAIHPLRIASVSMISEAENIAETVEQVLGKLGIEIDRGTKSGNNSGPGL